MARSFHYRVFALGVAIVAGLVASSQAQVIPETPAIPVANKPAGNFPDVEKAIDQFKARDYDGAVKTLREAAKNHPEDLPPAQVVMYQLFAQTGQADMARTALDNATAESPDDPEAYVLLGNVAIQEHHQTEADLLFTKALGLVKKLQSVRRKGILEPQAVSGMAAVAENRSQWSIAQNYLNELLTLKPKDTMALQRLARAYFWQQNPKDALAKLYEAKEADVDKEGKPLNTVVTPEAQLGRFYEDYANSKENHESAKHWMQKALIAAPNDLNTHQVVLIWALQTGDLKLANTEADRALEIDPKSLSAKILRGVVSLFEKDYATAEKWFENAHLQSPSTFAASNNLALALCEENDEAKLNRALEYASINYQQFPKNPDACATLGWVWFKKKDLQKADMALRQAIQSGPMNADTAYYFARVSNDSGRSGGKDDAKTLLKLFLQANKPFSMRPEATALLNELEKESPPAKKAS